MDAGSFVISPSTAVDAALGFIEADGIVKIDERGWTCFA